jgi:hypothetical protein
MFVIKAITIDKITITPKATKIMRWMRKLRASRREGVLFLLGDLLGDIVHFS